MKRMNNAREHLRTTKTNKEKKKKIMKIDFKAHGEGEGAK